MADCIAETVRVMSPDSRVDIGERTFRFVRRLMQNPDTRALIKARAEQIRNERLESTERG